MGKSRIENTVRNIQYGTLNQIITILFSFINRTVFISILGAEYLGINGLFSEVLTMLSMADLGFGIAMSYSFYKPLAENNIKKIAALVSFYKKVYNIIAFAVAIIGLALVPFLHLIVNLEAAIPNVRLYYLLFLANTVISYLFVYKSSLINADQKNYLISKYQVIINTFKIVFQIILLLITKSYVVYLLIQVISTVMVNIFISNKADSMYPYIKENSTELDKSERTQIYDNMKSIFLYKISGVFLNSTDNTIISTLIGTIWVGYYSNYNLIINALNSFINILYSSVTASVGNLVVKDTPKKRFEIFQSMQTVSLILTSFTTISFGLLINDFIGIWLGPEYILRQSVLIAILLNYYLSGVLRPIWTYRESTGLYVKTKYIMLIAAIINLILSLALGITFGMAGIIFASVLAKLLTYFWYEPKILFKEYFNENVNKYYSPLIKNFIITITLTVALFFISNSVVIGTWGYWVIKGFIVATIAIVSLILVYRNTNGFKLIISKFRR